MSKTGIAIGLICVAAAGLLGYRAGKAHSTPIEAVRDTIIIQDTITITEPVEVYHEVIKNHYEFIPVTDTVVISDTVYAVMSRERVVYQDSLYRAVISGVRPSLDSLAVYPQTTIITVTERPEPDRWHMGLSGGVGFSNKGFSPFIGFGLTYSFLSW